MDERFFPEVLQAVAADNYIIYVYMNDGSVRAYDLCTAVSGEGVMSALKDPDGFKKSLTVLNGTAAFDLTGNRDETSCIDIDPLTLYEAPRVRDPYADTGV